MDEICRRYVMHSQQRSYQSFLHTSLLSISHIQFTIEKEHNFSLPFLDELIKRNRSITIYQSPPLPTKI